jgi:hypothetical protein
MHAGERRNHLPLAGVLWVPADATPAALAERPMTEYS